MPLSQVVKPNSFSLKFVSHLVKHTHIHLYIKINTKHKTIWSFLSSVFNEVTITEIV